jgi:hypothetical protein
MGSSNYAQAGLGGVLDAQDAQLVLRPCLGLVQVCSPSAEVTSKTILVIVCFVSDLTMSKQSALNFQCPTSFGCFQIFPL